MDIRIAIETLGCKINQAESEKLARQLTAAGYTLVPPEQPADIYILNTCTVTHVADRKSRHRLRLAHRRNPNAALVVTGCYAERAAQELADIEGVRLVLDNSSKALMVRAIEESGLVTSCIDSRNNYQAHTPLTPASSTGQAQSLSKGKHKYSQLCNQIPPDVSGTFRTRTFIKVQDGCHNFCSYCVVPLVRHHEECLPPEQTISEIKLRQSEGYREIVITGVEVGSYRCGNVNIKGLLELVLRETDIPRIRLSSLQPEEITPELIDLWNNPRLCRHFHVSLQSGSETVLRRMNRHYTPNEYLQAISAIRSRIPEAAVTTDLITGFPGETDTEFADSREFCKGVRFARIHVFPYSPRKGTAAAAMPGQVDEATKKARTAEMLALAGECVLDFSNSFIPKTLPVLFEQQENGYWSGLTDNYLRVYIEDKCDLTNHLVPVRLGEIFREGVKGELAGGGTTKPRPGPPPPGP
jgi:threonylcarbamoyladenosine tRNA methylthiotransferase MtaB